MKIEKYSMGIGDRFGRQGQAQLRAFVEAARQGIHVTPVWNKSNREHKIVKTEPSDVRAEADAAVQALGWDGSYHVDADHIGLATVDRFIADSDFFTLDVADFTGKPAAADDVKRFVQSFAPLGGQIALPGLDAPLVLDAAHVERAANRYLRAVQEAGKLYRHIASRRDPETFITEVSMDETDAPQTPAELLVILAAIGDEKIPAQTIAPKFSGRFNKGVDYVGNVEAFAREFKADIAVVQFAIREFDLPETLKLSVHSGSDKFAIYPSIRRALNATGAGLHLKTAGTTWLEEVIGLARADGDGLMIAREIYGQSYDRFDELCGPYATVIDIDRSRLPKPSDVNAWSGTEFADALEHNAFCPRYNPHLRQLIHVGYKVAAELGSRYTEALREHQKIIAEGVTTNILKRHLLAVFG